MKRMVPGTLKSDKSKAVDMKLAKTIRSKEPRDCSYEAVILHTPDLFYLCSVSPALTSPLHSTAIVVLIETSVHIVADPPQPAGSCKCPGLEVLLRYRSQLSSTVKGDSATLTPSLESRLMIMKCIHPFLSQSVRQSTALPLPAKHFLLFLSLSYNGQPRKKFSFAFH